MLFCITRVTFFRSSRLLLSAVGVLSLVHASAVVAQEAVTLSPSQTELLSLNCVQCHAIDRKIGAPLLGDKEAWSAIAAQGEDAILENVIKGKGSMPPMGYCASCSEADFRAMIQFMAGLPKSAPEKGAP